MSKQLNRSWPFETETRESWAYWEGVFTKEECEQIITLGKKLHQKTANVLGGDKSVRDSKVSWIQPSTETSWIFARVSGVVMSLNEQYFKFDLHGFNEGFQFTEYNAPSGFYGPHVDCSITLPIRKLSITVELSDADSYEGGELALQYSETPATPPTAQGNAIVFPSFTLHEVKPVTKGTRYSLVGWVTGKPFK